MIVLFKKTTLKWAAIALALTLLVGCSSLSAPLSPSDNNQEQQNLSKNDQPSSGDNNATSSSIDATNVQSNSESSFSNNFSQSNTVTNIASSQSNDSNVTMLQNIVRGAERGVIINCNFPAKTTTIEDVEKVWGKADQTVWVASAKGRYATYASHNVVFGINKGEQIFEVRSSDSRLKNITLATVKDILGNPVYDVKVSGQEIIGYKAGSEFKVEMVFPLPAKDNPNPGMEHYNVLYPQGTVNIMADDPGRQW